MFESRPRVAAYVALLFPLLVYGASVIIALLGYKFDNDILFAAGSIGPLFISGTWVGNILTIGYLYFVIRLFILKRNFLKTIPFYIICSALIAPTILLILLGISLRASKITLGPF